jgi:hypothetical protein
MAIGHPLPALEAFKAFEMPEDLVEGYGLPPFDEALKRAILGENFLRLHGIDSSALRATIADDEVAQRQAAGLDEPWTHVRSRVAVGS